MIKILGGCRDADLELLEESKDPDYWPDKLTEEMAELTVAIRHVMLDEGHRDHDAMRASLVEELGDVAICVAHVYKTLPEELQVLVQDSMHHKIDRALLRRDFRCGSKL